MKFVHSSALTRSSILKKNKFDEKYKISGDFDLMVRVGKNIRSFFYNKPTIYYYSGGISRSKVSIANYECFLSLRHNKNFGLFKSLFFIFYTKFKIIIKKYIYVNQIKYFFICLQFDLKNNKGNYKSLFVIIFFRFASLFGKSYTKNKIIFILGSPFWVSYRLIIDWLMGIEIPIHTRIGPGLIIHHG